MQITEIKGNIFESDIKGPFVQCISADFGCGKGIAVTFNEHYNVKNYLQHFYPDYINIFTHKRLIGDCIYVNNVYNLITKERYYQKPTYNSLKIALNALKELCIINEDDIIKMPKIGCGLDKLEWPVVKQLLCDIFDDTDIKIFVYYIE